MKKNKKSIQRALKAARKEAAAAVPAHAEPAPAQVPGAGPKPVAPFTVKRRPWFPRTMRRLKIQTMLKWLGHRPGAVSTGADGREYVLLLDGSIRRLYRRGE